MLPEIEALEHHAQARSDALDLALINWMQITVTCRPQRNFFARYCDPAPGGEFQKVDTPEKRALAGTGRSNHRYNVTFSGSQRHTSQNLEFAERLVEVFNNNCAWCVRIFQCDDARFWRTLH